MPYDPTIALKVAQPQFDVGTAMQNALAIRNAQQAGQLNQLKLQQEQQAMQEAAGLQNYLASANLSTPEGMSGLLKYGTPGATVAKTIAERQAAEALTTQRGEEAKKTQFETAAKKQDYINQALQDFALNASDENITAWAQDSVIKGLFSENEAKSLLQQTLAIPLDQRAEFFKAQGATFASRQQGRTELEKLISLRNVYKVGTQERTDLENKIKLETTRAPAASTNVNVGVSTAKGIAENVGDIAKTSRTQATGAIKTMTSANEIRNALNSGLVIAGPTADLQMKFNQLLTEAGKGSPEKSKQLAQTRTAIINLSKLTLAARAELQGSGAISDFETKLLERAQSGDINDMSVEELQTVVDAAQKGAQFLWGEHQGLLDTMKSDPETAKLARYYTPAAKMPEAAGRTSSAAPSATKGSAQMPVKVNNSQERDKLAPGTVYIGPDGVKRTKS